MTINNLIYNPAFSLKYVLVYEKEAMLSSHEVGKGAFLEDCPECGEPPPPEFFLPPPPCSSDLSFGDDSWSCPAMMEPKDYRTDENGKISIAVVIVTAATFVLLAIVAALIIYRRRHHASQDSKGNPPIMGSAIIYDDLTPQIMQQQSRPPSTHGRTAHQSMWSPLISVSPTRYIHHPSVMCDSRGQYVRRTKPSEEESPCVSEPLYQTISSGSESRGSCCYPEEGVILQTTPQSSQHEPCDPEEDDSTSPFLKRDEATAEDSDSGLSKQETTFYLSVPVSSYFPSRSPSSLEYETLPLRGNNLPYYTYRGSPAPRENPYRGSPTPNEKGLPPLPSRSERFRMFLPTDRERPLKPSRTDSPINDQRPPGANTVLYENVGLSSHL